MDQALQDQVLDGDKPMTCRPADRLVPEFETLKTELLSQEKEQGLQFGEFIDDDVLTYALFPQPGLKFLANRNNPSAFEPRPEAASASETRPAATAPSAAAGPETYTVEVEGHQYVVRVSPGGDVQTVAPSVQQTVATGGDEISAPLSGNIFKVNVAVGDQVRSGDVVVVLEAMKMETEIRASSNGQVSDVLVKIGDVVSASDTLVRLAV